MHLIKIEVTDCKDLKKVSKKVLFLLNTKKNIENKETYQNLLKIANTIGKHFTNKKC